MYNQAKNVHRKIGCGLGVDANFALLKTKKT